MQEPATLRNMAKGGGSSTFPEGILIAMSQADGYIYAQVRIPGIHTDVPDDALPKYRVLIANEQTGHNGANALKLMKLMPGSVVQMLLYDEYGYNGVVLGSFATAAQEAGVLHGWSDSLGNTLKFMEDASVTYTHPSGTKLVISAEGDVTLDAKSYTVRSTDMSLQATNMSLIATNWNVESTNPTIKDGSGGPASPSAPELTAPEVPDAPDVSSKIEW